MLQTLKVNVDSKVGSRIPEAFGGLTPHRVRDLEMTLKHKKNRWAGAGEVLRA